MPCSHFVYPCPVGIGEKYIFSMINYGGENAFACEDILKDLFGLMPM